MSASHVVTLLKIANTDLPTLESKYEGIKQEVNSLQEQKRILSNQIIIKRNELEYYRARCQQETANFNFLQERRGKRSLRR
jgi:hypothetical protein